MHDITNPEAFLLGQPPVWHTLWFWVMIVSASIIVGILIYKISSGENTEKKRQQLLQSATEALLTLKRDSGSLPPQTLAVRISLILRQYLEAAFDDPALFETDEELTLRPDAMTKVDSQYRNQVIDHLHQLSVLKYAESDQQQRIDKLIDQALELLRIVEPVGTKTTSTDPNDSPSP
ncbi:MAG: hypothetical protein P8P36_08975 [Akkermansiaceae bacterium]|nr:hypothetical protein [Akkermansiaceae bacterium]